MEIEFLTVKIFTVHMVGWPTYLQEKIPIDDMCDTVTSHTQ